MSVTFAEDVGFEYYGSTPTICHIDIHAFAYFVEIGSLESPSNSLIQKRFGELGQTIPTAAECRALRNVCQELRQDFDGFAHQTLLKLLNILQPRYI